MPEAKLCPDGLLFEDGNPNQEKCDYPFNVNCGNRDFVRKNLLIICSGRATEKLYAVLKSLNVVTFQNSFALVSFFNSKYVHYEILLMVDFELQTSGI